MDKKQYLILVSATIILFAILSYRSSHNVLAVASDVQEKCITSELTKLGVNKETCYYKEFKKISEENGYEFAFSTLFELQKIDPDSQGCHLIAHGIGTGAYKRNPNDWQKLIQILYSGCSYGAIHGVIENYVATLPEKNLTPEIMSTLCGENPRADCNHIFGHLVLVQTEGNIDDGLKLCDAFNGDHRQKMFCYTGVFMEYQTALDLIEHGFAPKSWLNWPERVPELEKICRSYSGDAGITCWEEIVHAVALKFKNDAKKVFDFCSTAQINEGAIRCRRHAIGILVAGNNYDLEDEKRMCDLVQPHDPNFKSECYVYIIGSTLASIPQSGGIKAISMCDGLEEQYKKSCFGEIGTMYKDGASISRVDLTALCSKAPEEYRSRCLNGHQGENIYRTKPDVTD